MSSGRRLHVDPKELMFGLFYPAVLGTMFFQLLPEISDAISSWSGAIGLLSWKFALALLVVVHYTVDFCMCKKPSSYGWIPFGIDIFVLFLFFLAFDAIRLESSNSPDLFKFCASLSLSYVAFALWIYFNRSALRFVWRHVAAEVAFAIIFAAAAYWQTAVHVVAALLVLSAIGCLYAGTVVVKEGT